MRQGLLNAAHRAAGASFVESQGWDVAATFGAPADELRVCKEAVGLVDWTGWGILRLRGSDRLDFLQRMSTNDVLGLAPGQGTFTIFVTPIGRIVDLAFVLARKEELFLLVGRGADETVVDWLRRHIFFNDDVQVENLTAEWGMLGYLGPGATGLLETLLGSKVGTLPPYHWLAGQVDQVDGVGEVENVEVMVVRSVPWPQAYALLTRAELAPTLWQALAAAAESQGGARVGWKALETVRITAGWPRFGRELGEDYIPLEAGLKWAISFDKGCYVGQEIIARMDTYQRLAKRLVVLGWEERARPTGVAPTPGDEVWADESPVGQVTSVAPLADRRIKMALAYVKAAVAEPGHKLFLVGEQGKLEASILAVPERTRQRLGPHQTNIGSPQMVTNEV